MSRSPLLRPVAFALVAAALFGAATPASKVLLGDLSTFQLAGLLYLGAAVGVLPVAARGGGLRSPLRLDAADRSRLFGAVVAGGIGGPLLLLFGLKAAAAASVSLWLNFEVVATAVLGAFVFREPLGRAGWLGVAFTFAGAAALSLFDAGGATSGPLSALFVLLACACWGMDNHWTALLAGIPPAQTAFWKGLVAGTVNFVLGTLVAGSAPGPRVAGIALLLGAAAYGASSVLYVSAARSLGATRAQVVFSTSPLFGVLLSVLLLGEVLTAGHAIGAAFFFLGVFVITRGGHTHAHLHAALRHEHTHRHDDGHHDHVHPGLPADLQHSHPHRHEEVAHVHPHLPDLHHRHGHDPH